MASEADRPLAEALKSLSLSSRAIEYAVVDAFVGESCRGNPAAVVVLSEWKDDKWLQDVAAEFNLSETAYIVKVDKFKKEAGNEQVDNKANPDADGKPERAIQEYDLRWFTPETEVNLCGHATLASAHVLYHSGVVSKKDSIIFHTKGGLLSTHILGSEDGDAQNSSSGETKKPKEGLIQMNFPWITTTPAAQSDITAIHDTLSTVKSVSLSRAYNYLIVELETREDMDKLQPNMQELLKCETDGLLAIAPAGENEEFDFVSRCFFPKFGVKEDPVTGSAHCILGPYWATKYGQDDLLAYQVSKRGGVLALQMNKKIGRVSLAGQATISMAGVLLM